jgi:hypothetical protein
LPALRGSVEPLNGSPVRSKACNAALTVVPMSKHDPVL